MKEEVRRILQQVLAPQQSRKGLGSRIHRRVMELTKEKASIKLMIRQDDL